MNRLNGWMRLWVFLSSPFWIMAVVFILNGELEGAFYAATIGPAIMLTFGYGIAWVRRGFKKTN